MNLTAGEIMSQPVISVRSDTPVRNLMGLLNEKQISGVPVVDEQEHLVGVVSITDLLSLSIGNSVDLGVPDFHTSPAMDGLAQINSLLEPSGEAMDYRVSELMSSNVITAEEDVPVGALADTMLSHRIHRLIIVREHKAVGIVSVGDILRALRDSHRKTT
ncbi:MAG: CBS domain-containing protein [Candidatus Latescibacteria bacterium]|jgi:CBS domain-containing protein|nr:CBS domain-containing protein [Candidatus Latescibacterota bacterium]